MSRVPPQAPPSVHQVYNYPATHTTVPVRPGYYYEESEGSYIGDFSESEALSDAPHGVPHAADVTELYRRKGMHMVAPGVAPGERFLHRGVYYTQPEYYYEPVSTMVHPSQIRRPPTAPAAAYRRRVSVQDERIGHYYPTEFEDVYGRVAYKSTPHITATQQPASPSRAPSATLAQQATRRRPPVTVRTPRYYRRPGAVAKKPSALCIPVACQPDPAIYRRVRKNPVEPQYHQPEAAKQPEQTEDVNKMDSRGDVHPNGTDLDHMLARYEKIFSDMPTTSKRNEAVATPIKNVGGLKPRIPASVKARQEKLLKMKSSMKTAPEKQAQAPPPQSPTLRTSRRVEVEEITTEVLDNLLNELMRSNTKKEPQEEQADVKEHKAANPGLLPPEKEHDIREKASDVISIHSARSETQESQQPSKSFNYQDIKQHFLKVQRQNDEAKENIRANMNRPSSGRSPRSSAYVGISKSALDPASVMELHKSKSYIISLIDRALSKELGTIPEPKYANREFDYQNMDAKMAIDAMNKHIGGKDKDLCIEMTQALTESFVSNQAAASQTADKTEMSCPSLSAAEEPLYLKQLRQLRWGHFKHIQKEMRRLEDLERFLDTCTYSSGF